MRGGPARRRTGGAVSDTHSAPAVLAEVLDLGAVAAAFGMTRSGARRAVIRGDFGPYFNVGRRIFLRRESMLEAVKAREVTPTPRPGPPPVPEPPAWARDLLRRGSRAGGR